MYKELHLPVHNLTQKEAFCWKSLCERPLNVLLVWYMESFSSFFETTPLLSSIFDCPHFKYVLQRSPYITFQQSIFQSEIVFHKSLL